MAYSRSGAGNIQNESEPSCSDGEGRTCSKIKKKLHNDVYVKRILFLTHKLASAKAGTT